MGIWKFNGLWVDNTRAAHVVSTNYSFKANGERIIADGEVLGHTDGAVTTDLDVSTLIPTTAENIPLIRKVLDQADCAVTSLFDGKLYAIKGRFTQADVKSDGNTGKTEGSMKFEGGRPELVG